MTETMSYARKLLAKLKEARVAKENAEHEAGKISDELMPLLLALDPDKRGIVFEHEGAKSMGYRQQNAPGDVVDTVALIAWLKKNGLWDACSTQVLDMKKVEAEIAAKNISSRSIARFISPGTPAKPYVKFGAPKRDSL